MDDPATTVEGTWEYMSVQQRQVWSGEIPHYDHFKADVFGLGMTIYAMATLNSPEPWGPINFEENIRSKVPLLPFSQAIKDLLLKMLLKDEQQISTMHEIHELARTWLHAEDSA